MSAAAPPLPLEVREMTIGYGSEPILHDLSFGVRRGEILVIMGDSGSGKSTLMRHMIGIDPPLAGDVYYSGEGYWAAGQPRREELRGCFGVLFQGAALWSGMTLEENVALPLQEQARLPRQQALPVARLKLALVGLAGFEQHYPAEISGGMKKRAGLARAIALDPEILYFDEPSAGLDPLTSRRLDELIRELRDSLGTTVVLVTHELDSIFALGDRAVFLDAERRTMIAQGSPQELRESAEPKVRAFLSRGPR